MKSSPVVSDLLASQLRQDSLLRLLELNGAFVCVLDHAGLILSMSRNGAALLKREVAQVVGQHCSQFTPAEDASAARAFIDSVLATPGLHGPVVGRSVRGDGTLLWVETLFDSTDLAGAGLVALARDITARIEADEALQSQLLAAQRFEALGRLAGGVAHDLNNLLTAITGYSALLSVQLPAGTHAHGQAEEVRVAAQRAADLVRQLNLLGRAGTGVVRTLELGDQVDRLRDFIMHALGDTGRFVHERERSVELSFDPSSLEQSLVLLAVWLRTEQPTGARMLVRSGPRSLEPNHAARLGLSIGPHAMLEVELAHSGAAVEQPPLTIAAVAGVLSRVGAAIETFLLPENQMQLRLYWPLVSPPVDGPGSAPPPASPSTQLAAIWRPISSSAP